jgi:hypothetical protein
VSRTVTPLMKWWLIPFHGFQLYTPISIANLHK